MTSGAEDQTGGKRRRCYAEQLGDCSGALEVEHFISLGIQKIVADTAVRGAHWQEEGADWFPIGVGRYGHGRVICAKHHDDLDGIDPVAVDFFRAAMRIANLMHNAFGDIGEAASFTADGPTLRLWVLKVLCGAIAAGYFGPNRDLEPEWLEVLFRRRPWPEHWRLDFAKDVPTAQLGDATWRETAYQMQRFTMGEFSVSSGIWIRVFGLGTLKLTFRPTLRFIPSRHALDVFLNTTDRGRLAFKLAIAGLSSPRIAIEFTEAELRGTGGRWIGNSAVVDAVDVDHPLLYLK